MSERKHAPGWRHDRDSHQLSLLDRYLTLWIFLAMAVGVALVQTSV